MLLSDLKFEHSGRYWARAIFRTPDGKYVVDVFKRIGDWSPSQVKGEYTINLCRTHSRNPVKSWRGPASAGDFLFLEALEAQCIVHQLSTIGYQPELLTPEVTDDPV